MEHYFELPVTCNGEEQSFRGRLVTFGYVYKFYIVINGQEWVFEKDEQQYRVLSENNTENKAPDAALLQAVIEALNNLPEKNF